jgi:hypothetical protein
MIKCGNVYLGTYLVMSQSNNEMINVVPIIAAEDTKNFKKSRLSQFVKIELNNQIYYAIADQMKIIDSAKLKTLKGSLNNNDFEKIKEAVRKNVLICKEQDDED